MRQRDVSRELDGVNAQMAKAEEQIAQLEELKTKGKTMMKSMVMTAELLEPVPRSIILACMTNNMPSAGASRYSPGAPDAGLRRHRGRGVHGAAAVGGRDGVRRAQGLGALQQRYGPYLVGPKGLLQPIADIVKLFFKEELRPKAADAFLFSLAPIISVTTAFLAFAPVPFGAPTTFFGLLDEPIALMIADVNVAVLVIFAVASMGLYGIVLAGWASNSKYSLLGGLRSSAQMISYELAYGMALATVVMLAGSLSLREIVDSQSGYWFGFIPKWYVFINPISFVIFATAGVAETNRAPFDFPEAEQELVAGYHTEYSSMRFALFFLAEYINMVTVAAVVTNLYLGGWHGPLIPEAYGWIWFLIKLSVLCFGYLWLRWTLPRFRYDQLMSFGWKLLLPLATVNLLVSAAGVLYFGL